MNKSLFLLAPLFLMGCADSGIQGLWAFAFPVDTAAETCEDNIDENFKEYDVPEGDIQDTGGVGLEYEEEYTGTPYVMMAAIEQVGSEANLVFGGNIYPGVKDGSAWVFSWETGGKGTTKASFDDYSYRSTTDSSSTTTFTLSIKGNDLTGVAESEGKSSVSYVEADEWSRKAQDQVGMGGDIPASSYLVNGDGEAARNRADEAECSGGDCELKITSSCKGSLDFTGWRSGFDVKDAGDPALSATQPAANWD
ncbi:MAG TPA: hypothetical protein PKY30_03050 [Myxococcota bacterium]|nr:hypothetical protein [Myxococcota bacterium]